MGTFHFLKPVSVFLPVGSSMNTLHHFQQRERDRETMNWNGIIQTHSIIPSIPGDRDRQTEEALFQFKFSISNQEIEREGVMEASWTDRKE